MSASYESMVTVDTPKQEPKEALHPPGYREGVFPRETLGANEVIHWEGKPSLLSYLVLPIIATLLYYSFYLFDIALIGPSFLDMTLALMEDGSYLLLFFIVNVLPFLLFFAVRIIKWYRTSFAITNRRVMAKYGVFTTIFCDCNHDKVQNSVIKEGFWQWILGYGTLLFATSGHTGGIAVGTKAKMRNGGGIFWTGVPQPYEIKRYCEDIINYSINQTKKKDAERLSQAIRNAPLQEEVTLPAGRMGGEFRGNGDVWRNGPVHSPSSMDEKITSLNRLKDDGIITWDDYERMRKKIVGIE
ncbi:MAG: PH domain-containing protein [Methanomassiliicoccus sp.]|nr:PH domain-containing protein [Methanomassiliicoccus sp.]